MASEDHLLQHVNDRWNKLNEHLEHVPKFQNKNQAGVNEEQIKEIETKLKINLPKEIRTVIKVHNGRKKFGYGLGYRLPTTDLLPISQWKPYEINNENFAEDLFQCLADENDACADKHLKEDVQEHLKIYLEGIKKDKNYKLINDKTFQSIPCELLIIGEGMDDYAEQYLLSIRSGRIYIAIHNIPEWRLIGTFNDWIEKGLNYIKDQKDELKEQHDEIEID